MIVEPDCRGFRIVVLAQPVDGAWDAEVPLRRTLTKEPSHVTTITYRKPTVELAEERAAVWARGGSTIGHRFRARAVESFLGGQRDGRLHHR